MVLRQLDGAVDAIVKSHHARLMIKCEGDDHLM